jgi:hypothetical protein
VKQYPTNQCVALEVSFLVSVELDAWLIVLGALSNDSVLAECIEDLVFSNIKWQRSDIDGCILTLSARLIGFLFLRFALGSVRRPCLSEDVTTNLCFSIGLALAEIHCWRILIYTLDPVDLALLC